MDEERIPTGPSADQAMNVPDLFLEDDFENEIKLWEQNDEEFSWLDEAQFDKASIEVPSFDYTNYRSFEPRSGVSWEDAAYPGSKDSGYASHWSSADIFSPSAFSIAASPRPKSRSKDSGYESQLSHPSMIPSTASSGNLQPGRSKEQQAAHVCAHCGRTFGRASDARRHAAIQHKFRHVIRCSLCDREVPTAKLLKRHEMVVHRIGLPEYYRCAACPIPSEKAQRKYWTRRDNLVEHIRRMHLDWQEKELLEASKIGLSPLSRSSGRDVRESDSFKDPSSSESVERLSTETKTQLSLLFTNRLIQDVKLLPKYNESMFRSIQHHPGLVGIFLRLVKCRAETEFEHATIRYLQSFEHPIIGCSTDIIHPAAVDIDLQHGEHPNRFEASPKLHENTAVKKERESPGPEKPITSTNIILAGDYDIRTTRSAEVLIAFLMDGNEYHWLLMEIQKALTNLMPSLHISNLRNRELLIDEFRYPSSDPKTLKIEMDLEWNPWSLFYDEDMTNTASASLGSTITISSDIEDQYAYATTCGEYIQQMWPSHGTELLQCIENSFTSYEKRAVLEKDQLKIHVTLKGHRTFIVAVGAAASLLEVAEAAIWLGAACRASPSHEEIGTCFPIFHLGIHRTSSAFRVGYIYTGKGQTCGAETTGNCWQSMFRNPVIAVNSMIPRRDNHEEGLELSLGMLATLGQTFWATTFGATFLLKGFNSITVPIKRIANSVVWHFLVNKDGSRMPYHAVSEHHGLPTFGDAIFPEARHFVGWTETAESIAGTKSAVYDNIERSVSDTTSAGVCAEAAFSVTGGHFLSVGFRIYRASKDRPEYLSSEDYEKNLYSASRWGVIMADTGQRRHYMIDGATAILHLCRAALCHTLVPWAPSSVVKTINDFIAELDFAGLQEPEISLKTLRDPRIKDLPLKVWKSELLSTNAVDAAGNTIGTPEFEIKKTWQTFEDLTREMHHFLQQIHDRTAIRDRSAIDLQIKRRVIVGFDLTDLLLKTGPIAPRSKELLVGAEKWLDISLKLGTINLLGSNFGTLIRPRAETHVTFNTCQLRTDLPAKRDYLAVCLSVLRTIIDDKRLNHTEDAVQVADGVFWTRPADCFALCKCDRGPAHTCSALAQESSFITQPATSLSTHSIFGQFPNAAIIFGYEPKKLTKKGGRKRKADCSEELGPQVRSQSSDSGVEVGSSNVSNSPDTLDDPTESKHSSGWSFRGAASRRKSRKHG